MYLTVIAGAEIGRRYVLNDVGGTVIGRQLESQVQISEANVSRRHCLIEIVNGVCYLEDLVSRSGTLVNDQRVTRVALAPGDVIQVGKTRLRLALETDVSSETLPPDTQWPAAPPESLPLQIEALLGSQLAGYDLEQIIAKAQTGVVFRARDTSNGQLVAVKVLWPHLANNEEHFQRFVRGMQTAAELRHENIVRVLRASKKGSHVFVVSEFIDGENLNQVIARIGIAGRLEWQAAFRVCVQIARALELAELKQIVHRNVSPSNILIRKSDKVALLNDLFLAKALEGVLAREVTGPGQLIGDLAYMAPERTYSSAEIDCRSDLYSLGAMTYALLTGHPPYVDKSLTGLVMKVRDVAPEPPTKYQLGVPALLEGVVLKLLAKQPNDRYASATALLKDLARVAQFQGLSI